MPKWNSLYCISLSSWRMLVIKGIQIAIVPLLWRAQCVLLLVELHGYQQGMAQTQGCAELCLTHGRNWPQAEVSLSGWFCLRLRVQSLQYFSHPYKLKPCLQVMRFACLLCLLNGKMLWRYRDPYSLLMGIVANSMNVRGKKKSHKGRILECVTMRKQQQEILARRVWIVKSSS